MFIKKASLLLLFISTSLFSLPEIDFRDKNIIYKQFKSDLDENRRRIKTLEPILPIQLYEYKVNPGDTIFSVSSRFNLNYDTIATLNSIPNQLFFPEYKEILIPNCHGKFFKTKMDDTFKEIYIGDEKFYFSPGGEMSKEERISFLVSPFSSPLKKMKITSSFGNRENPFTGLNELHPGIDLKAAIGTKIYSPYSGKIVESSYNDFLGNVLIIDHGMGYTSHYYHLDSIVIKKGSFVKKGELVAKTGNSGRSTGPHLHFEIRKEDEVINPVRLLGDI